MAGMWEEEGVDLDMGCGELFKTLAEFLFLPLPPFLSCVIRRYADDFLP